MTETLHDVMNDYGADAYLLTVGTNGPHTSLVTLNWQEGRLACTLGKSAARNVASQPNVSLLWPPLETGGDSIVVNALITIAENDPHPVASLPLTKAVFHRAGARPEGSTGPCPNDCKPISI